MIAAGEPALRELRAAEWREAARLLGRAMCSNPINVRVFAAADDAARSRILARFFEPVLRGLSARGIILGAYAGDALTGVCAMAPPGRCAPTFAEKLRILPAVVRGGGVAASLRVMRWSAAWAHRDPKAPHWHLGPVAVDPAHQGRGVGRTLLAAFCRRMDEGAATAWLETDKLRNVEFYRGFGFEVSAEARVLGVPCWFMLRRGSR